MINNDPITLFEATKAGSFFNDLSTWLVSGYHPGLVAFGALAEVLVVNGANI